MTVSLTITAGPDAGRTCDLPPGGTLVVGRGPGCGLRLTDPGVSRVHCRLSLGADGVRLEDADSRYGTTLNRRPVASGVARPGDTIGAGDTELRVNRESAAETVARPARGGGGRLAAGGDCAFRRR